MKVCVSVPLTLMTWACIVTLTFTLLFHVPHACKLRQNCSICDLVCRCVCLHEVKRLRGVHGRHVHGRQLFAECRAPSIRCALPFPLCAALSVPFRQHALLWHHVQTKRSDDIHEAVSDGFTALIRQLIKRLLLPLSAELIPLDSIHRAHFCWHWQVHWLCTDRYFLALSVSGHNCSL